MKGGQAIAAIAFLLSTLLLPRLGNADSVEPITIVLAQSTAPVDAGKPMVVLTITNNGDSPVTLYKFRLPFNWNGPLPNNQFEVRDIQGMPQQYIGDFDYVVGASPDKFTELQPHETMSGKVELRYSYSFDTQVFVKFKVRYSLPLGIVSEGNELDENSPDYATNPNRRRIIQSNELQITIDPTAPLDPPANAAKAESDALSAPNSPWNTLLSSGYKINDPHGTCTDGQPDVIVDAFLEANIVAGASISYVSSMFGSNGFEPSTAAAKAWTDYFGAYDGDGKMPGQGGSYYTRVGQTVAKMRAILYDTSAHSGLAFSPETRCGCPSGTDPDVAAKARPYYTILLCPKFFALPARGALNSRALTLFHELSHYKSAIDNGSGGTVQVPATGDYGYTDFWDRSLAKDDPAKAVANAENYEKFGIQAMQNSNRPGW